MKTKLREMLRTGGLVAAALCIGAAYAQAAGNTYNLNNLASGNWNILNQRTANNYQIGFSTEHPNIQAAYFEYDLTPAKGKTVTGANLLIIGSTDYHISTFWPNHPGSPPQVWFKVGVAAMNVNRATVSQIVTGNNIANLYHYQCDANQNPDGGYVWVKDGLHQGVRFDAFHYESTGKAPPRIQNAVNAGGDFVMWSCDRFDSGNDGENYIWGSTAFNSGNQFQIITSN
jgi:hypothetical protein